MSKSGQPKRPESESGEAKPDAEAEVGTDDAPTDGDEADATLAELQARADDHWDRYLRAAAEVENIRKRASRDVENARKYALESMSRELLGVKDSLEMGLAASDSADAGSLIKGSLATLKLLTATLEHFGVSELDPEGEPFDPELHEAVSMQPSADVEPGSVLTVVQKGYALNGRLLRPASVIVAAEVDEAAAEE